MHFHRIPPRKDDVQLFAKYNKFEDVYHCALEMTKLPEDIEIQKCIIEHDRRATFLLGNYIREEDESRKQILNNNLQELLTKWTNNLRRIVGGEMALINGTLNN